jgi:hypothetical protein
MGTLKIIVVAYFRALPLQIMINCFRIQTDKKWEMHIIHDGPAPEDVKAVIPEDPRIFFYETEKRLQNYGHPNRRYMLNTIQVNTNDFILITNDDNYYMPEYVRYMRQV